MFICNCEIIISNSTGKLINFSFVNSIEIENSYVGYSNYDAMRQTPHRMLAPLYQQLTDWFREKHKLHIEIQRNYDGWCYVIYEFSQGNKFISRSENETTDYHIELEIALTDAFKLI